MVSPSLGAVWNWNKDKIMKQAQESAARYQNGTPLSIVDGVPVIVKGKRLAFSTLLSIEPVSRTFVM
jgi:Asp-tRNA(Asn)/Glu-tRNA(Gln) amidotransferase A subunit family amidase